MESAWTRFIAPRQRRGSGIYSEFTIDGPGGFNLSLALKNETGVDVYRLGPGAFARGGRLPAQQLPGRLAPGRYVLHLEAQGIVSREERESMGSVARWEITI